MFNTKCLLEIDLKIIENNYLSIKNLVQPASVALAAKANCYGLGIKYIAPALYNLGCRHYFVFSLEEAIELKSFLIGPASIYILLGFFGKECREIIHHGFIPVLNHFEQVKSWYEYTHNLANLPPCAIHLNTGMHRLGMLDKDITDFLSSDHQLNICLIMSHLSASEDGVKCDKNSNLKQLMQFKGYINHFQGIKASIANSGGIYFQGIKASIANSGGIFLGAEYHLDLVRPGAAIYGLHQPNDENQMIKSPVKLLAPIIQLQNVSKNSSIGYNMTYTTKTDSIIATLPLGYADGYSRMLSNIGKVYIDNIAAPVVGRVSMDLVNIDVTHVDKDKIYMGRQVEIIGENCTVDMLAEMSGTIGYEVLTSLSSRFQRVYK